MSYDFKSRWNNLKDEWIYINGAPYWEHKTISLSVYEASQYKRITVICLYRRPDGSFLYPFKLHITSAKIKANIKNGKIKVCNVGKTKTCLCYLIPISLFTEGVSHVPGVDYNESLKTSSFYVMPAK